MMIRDLRNSQEPISEDIRGRVSWGGGLSPMDARRISVVIARSISADLLAGRRAG